MTRRELLLCRKAAFNAQYAQTLKQVFSQGADGLLCWLNLVGWTYDPRTKTKVVPFITWDYQDNALRTMWSAVHDGADLHIEKSRDMGASWLNVATFVWFWLFEPDSALLMASRKESYVDASGNPDTLFWKVDFLIAKMPSWLKPRMTRRLMHLSNDDNGSVIDGESTNNNLGRGGRRRAILLDEFAACENGEEICSATADATNCRIYNSTPRGSANKFADLRFNRNIRHLSLHWSNHPIKGADATTKNVNGKLTFTSTWYEQERARRGSPQEIAQEIDIDYHASLEAFFDLVLLDDLMESAAIRPADTRGDLRFNVTEPQRLGDRTILQRIHFEDRLTLNRLALWIDLDEFHNPPPGRYALFADISHGTGASNSVIKVGNIDRMEEVASFVCCNTPPHELARYAVALCMWFGSQTPPLLGWEINGPGTIFEQEVDRLRYSRTLRADRKGHAGWFSDNESKYKLLSDLRSAIATRSLTIHDRQTLTEAQQYIFYRTGDIGPSKLVNEPDGARSAHGDRVIAMAGLVHCMKMINMIPSSESYRPPMDTFAGRKELHRRQSQRDRLWD